MAVKTAAVKAKELGMFIQNARKAIGQFEELKKRLDTDEDFQRLWETDSAEALRQVGIDPDARTEIGFEPYDRGPECHNCITPMGNACHC